MSNNIFYKALAAGSNLLSNEEREVLIEAAHIHAKKTKSTAV
jgi:hypothetical protein|tara:strand:- start:1594 stop:1719 length:126 start_codon:yes stop_codon:yes gene_type:complete